MKLTCGDTILARSNAMSNDCMCEPRHEITYMMSISATRMDPDQSVHLVNLFRIHNIHFKILYECCGSFNKQEGSSPECADAQLMWIHTGCKVILLVFSWRGSCVSYSARCQLFDVPVTRRFFNLVSNYKICIYYYFLLYISYLY